MAKRRKTVFIYFIFILIFIIFVTSCSKKQEKPIPVQEKSKVPGYLNSMSEEADKIVEKIEKIDEEIKKPEFKEETGKEEKKEEGDGEKSKGEEEKDKSNENEQKPSKEEKVYLMWEEIKKSVEGIHTSWNNYEVEAIDRGIDKDDIQKFEEALNKLTIAVDNKSFMDSLVESNQMILYMSSFFDFYKGSSQGDILRMKYYIRQSYLYGMAGDWDGASKNMEESTGVLKQIKKEAIGEEKTKKMVEKLAISLDNMANGIKEKNLELLKIKRDISLKNLEDIGGELEGKSIPAFYRQAIVN